MDTHTRELLRGSLREMFAQPDVDFSRSLADLGWGEVLAEEPAEAISLLFAEQGRARARSAALDEVVLAELRTVLPAARAGRAVLYPVAGQVPGNRIEGVLLAAPSAVVEVVAPSPDGVALLPFSALKLDAPGGFDPDAGWRRAWTSQPDPISMVDFQAWEPALAAGRRALAAELTGLSEAVLALTVEHTSNRVQYGRPIASYQSVRHRLAEAKASITSSAALLGCAWSDNAWWSAAAAKAQAGLACAEVCRHAMQVCGAIGLSHEHSLHRFVRRGAVLDALLGSSRELQQQIGRRLLDGFIPPRVVEL